MKFGSFVLLSLVKKHSQPRRTSFTFVNIFFSKGLKLSANREKKTADSAKL